MSSPPKASPDPKTSPDPKARFDYEVIAQGPININGVMRRKGDKITLPLKAAQSYGDAVKRLPGANPSQDIKSRA